MEAMRRMRDKMKDDLARQREAERLFRLEQKGQALYHPSVYRYRCYGKLQLTSDLPGSEGVCRGFATHLEHVRDIRPSTRRQAIDAFAPIPPPEMADTFQHTDKELTRIMERDAMIYEENKNELQETTQKQERAAQTTSYHDWDLYGSTEVEVVILKHVDTQQEEIAAVVPRCSFGCSFRDAASSQNSFIYSDLHFGKNAVRLAGLVEGVDDESENTARQPDSKSKLQQSHASVTSTNTSMLTVESIQAGVMKVAEKASLILTHAYQNSLFVVQEVSSREFPRKWFDSADRIVNQVPTTVHNVQKFTLWAYKEGYRWATGREGDGDDD